MTLLIIGAVIYTLTMLEMFLGVAGFWSWLGVSYKAEGRMVALAVPQILAGIALAMVGLLTL